jgi:hypothetical protein
MSRTVPNLEVRARSELKQRKQEPLTTAYDICFRGMSKRVLQEEPVAFRRKSDFPRVGRSVQVGLQPLVFDIES